MALISSIVSIFYLFIVLGFTSAALGHGGDEHMNMNSSNIITALVDQDTYFHLVDFASLMRLHIVLMTISWVFILPAGLYSSLHTEGERS